MDEGQMMMWTSAAHNYYEKNRMNKSYNDIMLEHAQGLNKIELSLGREYTKTLLTAAGGALGLSATLLSGAFGAHFSQGYCYLYTSWISLGLCILLILFSIKASQMAFRKEVKLIYEEYKKKDEISSEVYSGGWVKFSEFAEIFAGILFIIGLIYYFLFIIKNME